MGPAPPDRGRVQRNRPSNRALECARVHDGVDRGDGPEVVVHGDGVCDHAHASCPGIPPTPTSTTNCGVPGRRPSSGNQSSSVFLLKHPCSDPCRVGNSVEVPVMDHPTEPAPHRSATVPHYIRLFRGICGWKIRKQARLWLDRRGGRSSYAKRRRFQASISGTTNDGLRRSRIPLIKPGKGRASSVFPTHRFCGGGLSSGFSP